MGGGGNCISLWASQIVESTTSHYKMWHCKEMLLIVLHNGLSRKAVKLVLLYMKCSLETIVSLCEMTLTIIDSKGRYVDGFETEQL